VKDLIGVKIGRYEIQAKIGEGGMAMVYRAYDARLKRDVALKVIHASNAQQERFYKRFEREARAMAVLTHPGIVQIFDVGDYNGLPYLVMEYLPGGTLKRYLGRPVAWQEAVSMLLPVSDALSFAHKQGIIHRDVKPSNILLDGMGRTRLSDFGIAKFIDQRETMELTGTNLGVGTPEYMAPEQGLGQDLDERADIYALATVCFELVTGQKPFRGNEALAILVRKINEQPPHAVDLLHGLPKALDETLFKAMSSKPDARHATMASFSISLSSLLGKSHTGISPEGIESEVEEQATKDFDLLSPESLELVLDEYREKLEEMQASIPDLREQVQEAVAAQQWAKVQEITEKITVCENSQATYQEMIARLGLISELHEQGDAAIQSGNWDEIDTVIVRLGELGQTGERYAKLLKRNASRAQQNEVDRIAQQVSDSIQKRNWQAAEAGLAGLNDLGATAEKTVENLQANYQAAQQAEEQQRKEIQRLSGFVNQALRDEDWGKAEAALKALNGLGADGQSAAQPLLKQYEIQHKHAEQLEAQARDLFAKVQTAADAADWAQAEAGLNELRQLDAKGITARLDQLAAEVQAKQASAIQRERERAEAALAAEQQKAEIKKLSNVIREAIVSEEWREAKSALARLEKLGAVGGQKAIQFKQRLSDARKAAQAREEAARAAETAKEIIVEEPVISSREHVEAVPEQVEIDEAITQPEKKRFPAFAKAGMAVVVGLLAVGAGMILLRDNNVPAMAVEESPIAAMVLDTVTMTATQAPTRTETPMPTATLTEVSTETPIPSPTPITKISEKDGMEMVFVPAGEFIMGSDEGNPDEQPEHIVYLDGYWIDKYEVTNSQYSKCMLTGACSMNENSDIQNPILQDYPVMGVKWVDANNYCKWVGRRLPSEAEWEKAARGTDGRVYPWGNEKPSSLLVNLSENIEPSVSYQAGASIYGALNMAGNAWEWVKDWYGEDYYEKSALDNPTGPLTGQNRVLRGGTWNNIAWVVRSSYRKWGDPDNKNDLYGFRCAVSAEEN
jgi:formylglycine-generating enzyme required for sulfatase activity/serine/threonine protein kinase